MATTSGTYSFNYNRDQIINSAARKIGAIASGEVLSASAITDFSDQLNIMVKAWDASGIHIWSEAEATLFLQPGQNSYTLGGSSGDHAALSYVATTLASSISSGGSSATVASATSIGTGDSIGIVMDSGSVFWTTISSISGTSVTLASGLTSGASSGNAVYDYTSVNAIVRPLRVLSARRYNFSSAIETPMDPMMSRLDYRALPNKSTTGVPTRAFYDPRGGANTQGVLYVWPTPVDATNGVNFTWMRPLQDFNASANIPDLPNEWLNAVILTLAEQMALDYDCPAERFAMIQSQAAQARDLALGFDREAESYLFGADMAQV